jgi:hypothetical protein
MAKRAGCIRIPSMGLPLIPLDSSKDVKAIDNANDGSFISEDQIEDWLF